jgi:PAS domain S-box-containing protein
MDILRYAPSAFPAHWKETLTDNPINTRADVETEEAFKSGETRPSYALELRRGDGSTIWVEITESPISRLGKIVGMVGTAHDITDQIVSVQRLRSSEAQYRILFERSPICIVIFQEDGVLYANPTATTMTGYEASELAGDNLMKVIHPEDRDLIRGRIARRLKGETVPSRYEARVVTKGGETIWLDLSSERIEFEGKPTLIAHGIDITERKKADHALREAEARYRDLYENATDIIYTHDLEFRLLSVNRVAERLLGWREEEFIGRDLREIIEPAYREIADRTFQLKISNPEQQSKPYELQLRTANGEHRWFEVSSRVISDSDGPKAVTGIARDITDRKRLETQLRQVQKMDALGQLAGGIAHDFNNLLTGILGYARVLGERTGDDSACSDAVRQIEKAADRAATLTRQLLAFSRQRPLQSRRVNLNRVVLDVAGLLSRTVGEHIGIETDLAEDLMAIYADPVQIEQVLLNLAVNARDAMPDGGQIRIATRMFRPDFRFRQAYPPADHRHYIELLVSDTGIGMDEEVRERVFEPFFTTKPPEQGTGLGLSIVYGICQQHDGFVELKTERGVGTTFRLFFPAAGKPPAHETSPPAPAVPGGRERILVAEDDEIVRQLAGDVLREAGYAVKTVRDGAEAIRTLQEDPTAFDLILLDMVMPYKSGVEVWREATRAHPGIGVLLTSGYSPQSNLFIAETEDAPPFLAKPFTPEALLERVREVVANHGGNKADKRDESPDRRR